MQTFASAVLSRQGFSIEGRSHQIKRSNPRRPPIVFPLSIRRVFPHNEAIAQNPPSQPLRLLLRRRREERRRSFFYKPVKQCKQTVGVYSIKKGRTRYRRSNLPLKRRRGNGTVGRPRPLAGPSTGHSEDMEAGKYLGEPS